MDEILNYLIDEEIKDSKKVESQAWLDFINKNLTGLIKPDAKLYLTAPR